MVSFMVPQNRDSIGLNWTEMDGYFIKLLFYMDFSHVIGAFCTFLNRSLEDTSSAISVAENIFSQQGPVKSSLKTPNRFCLDRLVARALLEKHTRLVVAFWNQEAPSHQRFCIASLC